MHAAVDTLGHLLAPVVAPAGAQDGARVEVLAPAAPAATGHSLELADADQGSTGERAGAVAAGHDVRLAVVKLEKAKRGFVPPPRWVVERSVACGGRVALPGLRRVHRLVPLLAERPS